MTYYNDDKQLFWLGGMVVQMTEAQAEEYMANNLDADLLTASETDLAVQDENEILVAWVDGQPVSIDACEWDQFQQDYCESDVALEYTSRNAPTNGDMIDCKCTDDIVCKDCQDFFDSLLDD